MLAMQKSSGLVDTDLRIESVFFADQQRKTRCKSGQIHFWSLVQQVKLARLYPLRMKLLGSHFSRWCDRSGNRDIP